MNCRPGCAACCIAQSISTPVPCPAGGAAMPKRSGTPCTQLDDQLRCRLFGQHERPAVCTSLQPDVQMCGHDRHQALVYLTRLEQMTAPAHTA